MTLTVWQEIERRSAETKETAADLYANLLIEATEREMDADDADVVQSVLKAVDVTPERFEADVAKRRTMLELEPVAAPWEELSATASAAHSARMELQRCHAEVMKKLTAKHPKEMDEAERQKDETERNAKGAKEALDRLIKEFPASTLPTPEQKATERRRREVNVGGLSARLALCEKRVVDQSQQGIPVERNAFAREAEALRRKFAAAQASLAELE